MTKNDSQLQTDVIEELGFDPTVDATQIGVGAKDGVITLTGTVDSYPEKLAAERAVKRVAGVHGIAEELKIDVPATHQRGDADIARAAVLALEWDTMVPKNKVTVKVENGWLTLEGELDSSYQRDAARRAVEHLVGLYGVSNSINIKSTVFSGDVRAEIRKAFGRAAEIDANKVQVEINNGVVTLRGDVHAWNERDEASVAALSVPGVKVVNNLTYVI
jgi:osmotically-inducible protein OsmY